MTDELKLALIEWRNARQDIFDRKAHEGSQLWNRLAEAEHNLHRLVFQLEHSKNISLKSCR